MSTRESTTSHAGAGASPDAAPPLRSARWLPPLLSVIAGMVNLIKFLRLGIYLLYLSA